MSGAFSKATLWTGSMFDFRPYLLRPFSTLASITSDPLEAWLRFREQRAAYKEGPPPADLYKVQHDWEYQLHRRIELSDSDEVTGEFWALWATVVEELDAKGIRAGPASFKGWNDGDAGFVTRDLVSSSLSPAQESSRNRRGSWGHVPLYP